MTHSHLPISCRFLSKFSHFFGDIFHNIKILKNHLFTKFFEIRVKYWFCAYFIFKNFIPLFSTKYSKKFYKI